jgi:hypothetical protein
MIDVRTHLVLLLIIVLYRGPDELHGVPCARAGAFFGDRRVERANAIRDSAHGTSPVSAPQARSTRGQESAPGQCHICCQLVTYGPTSTWFSSGWNPLAFCSLGRILRLPRRKVCPATGNAASGSVQQEATLSSSSARLRSWGSSERSSPVRFLRIGAHAGHCQP